MYHRSRRARGNGLNATLASAACCLILLPVLVIGAALGGSDQTVAALPTTGAVGDIPADYLALYQQAAAAYGLPWELLAGIGKVECDNGQSSDPACFQEGAVNSAGAGGPMQFLATTFAEYGTTPDGTGTPDRWNPADAVYSAANYLKASGAPQDIPDAVYAYNHSQTYVNQVIAYMNTYTQEADAVAPITASTGSTAAEDAVTYALGQIGTPYEWGAEDPGVAFDCSGLTQAAYQATGITLPRTAQSQYDAGPPVPAGQPLEPGDLAFFGQDASAVDHVGIVSTNQAGEAEMIDAPHTGAQVREEPFPSTPGTPWGDLTYLGATRPAV